jgi:hypothetical protein
MEKDSTFYRKYVKRAGASMIKVKLSFKTD